MSIDPNRTIAGFRSVHEAFADTARRMPAHPCLHVLPDVASHYGIAAGEIGYGAALVEIDRLVKVYAAAAYGHGQRVGLLLENRPAFFMHWFALNALGVSVVPINAELRPAEFDYLIEHSELCLVVSVPAKVAELQASVTRTGRAVAVVTQEAFATDGAGLPPSAGPRLARAAPAITLDTECALLYTSGTTGQPKGCVLANEYYLQCGHWYNTVGGLCRIRPGEERLITPLPLTHMNAMACSSLAMFMSGGCLVQLDRFHPKSWWQHVRQSRATIVHYLGVMPAMLMADAASPDDRAHAVQFGFGAGVDRRLQAPFEERFGFPLLEAWAMTETGNGAVIIANHEPRKVGASCFGKAEAGMQARVVDDEGRDVAADQPGELLVRASADSPRFGFFREYLKDEQATREAWEGGWFHTGDLVRRDEEGYFYFVDRKKNVIRRSGENIAAVEVESVLRRHPLVRDVAVAATPDPIRGDEVLACVLTREPLPLTEREAVAHSLVALSLDQLAYYKAPGYVAFVDALPLTASQKVQRGELKKLATELPGTAGCIDTRHLKRRQA